MLNIHLHVPRKDVDPQGDLPGPSYVGSECSSSEPARQAHAQGPCQTGWQVQQNVEGGVKASHKQRQVDLS